MNNIFITDVETGGLSSENNPITQIGIIVVDPISLLELERYESYIKPYNNLTITKEALNASRVSYRDIENGKEYGEVIQDVIKLAKKYKTKKRISGKPMIVGHNIKFDRKFLVYLFNMKKKDLYEFFDEDMMDTLKICMNYEAGSISNGDVDKYNLTACCERFGIKLSAAHGAIKDCEATHDLWKELTKRLRASRGGNIATDDSGEKVKREKSRKNFHFEY